MIATAILFFLHVTSLQLAAEVPSKMFVYTSPAMNSTPWPAASRLGSRYNSATSSSSIRPFNECGLPRWEDRSLLPVSLVLLTDCGTSSAFGQPRIEPVCSLDSGILDYSLEW